MDERLTKTSVKRLLIKVEGIRNFSKMGRIRDSAKEASKNTFKNVCFFCTKKNIFMK